jgi:hypothetical protein
LVLYLLQQHLRFLALARPRGRSTYTAKQRLEPAVPFGARLTSSTRSSHPRSRPKSFPELREYRKQKSTRRPNAVITRARATVRIEVPLAELGAFIPLFAGVGYRTLSGIGMTGLMARSASAARGRR